MSFQPDRNRKSDLNESGQPLSWLVQLVLRTFVPPEWREPLTGDLLEEWTTHIAPKKGRFTRWLWSWQQVFGTIFASWQMRLFQLPKGLQITLLVALVFGWGLAYVDSRPNWDDTGVLALGIFLTCGILGAVFRDRPWSWAILVGIWIPGYQIFFNRNLESLLALAIAFGAAYLGAFFRSMICRIVRIGDPKTGLPGVP